MSKENDESSIERAKKIKDKENEKDKKSKKKKHPKLRMFFKILLIIILLLLVIGAGIVAAVFFGVFGDDFKITKDELLVGDSNSIVLNKDGEEIANLSTDEERKTVSINEMSQYIPKAYVAIEDKRFYKHNGIDIKRTTGAIINTLLGKSSYGGSSITQQLVKNKTKDDERSGIAGINRKIREWAKAIQVERMISKDQILELYLNTVYIGGSNLYGVEIGSEYYFNKSAKDLTLAESAFLAGINSRPGYYDPISGGSATDEERKDKTLTVINEMLSQKLISQEEYDTAKVEIDAGLKFQNGYKEAEATYSYHTAATLNQVIQQVMDEKNISYELAKNYVYGGGLTIYSTEDSKVQKIVEDEFAKSKYQIKGREKKADGTLKNDHTQAGITIIDNATGQVVAVGGKLGEKNSTGLNRATQTIRQTGSSMKIIADIAPGLQEKVITPSTMYDDTLTDFGGNYKPGDYNNPKGIIDIRSCIRTSQNIPMVKVMRELTVAKAATYLQKMGISTLTDSDKTDNLAISIGGLSQGISTLEMAGAYETLANNGQYKTPIFFTKVVDGSGNTVLTAKQDTTDVYTEQTAYLARSIAEEPTKAGGTATYCKINGMETCAKTGSTDKYMDRWLCGMTPYYTAACWWGFDTQETLTYSSGITYSVDGKNPAGALWSNIMSQIHVGLANKNFDVPKTGIVTQTVCDATGCLATDSCTSTHQEQFSADNLPDKCQGHGTQKICIDSGKIATDYCPNVKMVSYGGVIPKEQLGLWKAVNGSSRTGVAEVTETCTLHTKPVEKPSDAAVVTNVNTTTEKKPTNGTSASNKTNTAGNTPKPANELKDNKTSEKPTENKTETKNIVTNTEKKVNPTPTE